MQISLWKVPLNFLGWSCSRETTTCVSPLELGFGELKHDYILKHDCDFGFKLVILEGRRGKRFFFEVG